MELPGRSARAAASITPLLDAPGFHAGGWLNGRVGGGVSSGADSLSVDDRGIAAADRRPGAARYLADQVGRPVSAAGGLLGVLPSLVRDHGCLCGLCPARWRAAVGAGGGLAIPEGRLVAGERGAAGTVPSGTRRRPPDAPSGSVRSAALTPGPPFGRGTAGERLCGGDDPLVCPQPTGGRLAPDPGGRAGAVDAGLRRPLQLSGQRAEPWTMA